MGDFVGTGGGGRGDANGNNGVGRPAGDVAGGATVTPPEVHQARLAAENAALAQDALEQSVGSLLRRDAVFLAERLGADIVDSSVDDATRAGWAAKEEDQAKAYEAAKEARDAAGGQVPPTEYRMKLRDPSVPQLLMRLPAEGFRAFTTFGVGGQREQRASLRHMSLTYNVQEEQLTVSSCTVAL